jgi:[ribosomal protein S5]-alanine N-acetyltransferase
MIPTMARTRLIATGDAAPLADLARANREFLGPWEPIRPEEYFTVDGQRRAIEEALERYEYGTLVPHVIVDRDQIVGRVTLTNIVRGAFQSCNLGYWVAFEHNGRGFATGAVREIMTVAFRELGLHRIEAGTLLHNIASQRVLERNSFERFGVAPRYLNIAGRWQDHALYQALSSDGESMTGLRSGRAGAQ